MRLVNMAEFAREMKTSPTSISRLIKNGVLAPASKKNKKMKRYEIDLELGKELFNSHSSQRLQVVTDDVKGTAQSINLSRSKKIHFDALTAELNYRERLGELVETKQVEKEAFEIAKIVRDKLLQIADRLAPVVTGQKKESYVFKKIEKEINRVLKLLSD